MVRNLDFSRDLLLRCGEIGRLHVEDARTNRVIGDRAKRRVGDQRVRHTLAEIGIRRVDDCDVADRVRCVAARGDEGRQHDKARDHGGNEQRHHHEPPRAHALEVFALGDNENFLIHGRTFPSRCPEHRRVEGRFDAARAASSRIGRFLRQPRGGGGATLANRRQERARAP